MSEESSPPSQPTQANYTAEDIELYYYFWVTPNGVSWYQTLKVNDPPKSYSALRQKIFSPFAMMLLGSSLLLGLLGVISWYHDVKAPKSNQQQATIVKYKCL